MVPRRVGSPREWNAGAYDPLDRPQLSWGRAILATMAWHGNETVLDAGCGTGKLAAEIAARLPRGRVIAIDRSANMLETLRQKLGLGADARVAAVQADLAALPLALAVDVIFSTAAFHWVLDHDRLFRELHAALKPGGRLVAQCGGGPNLARILTRVDGILAAPPFRQHVEGWTGPWLFADARATASRLAAAGFVEVETSLVEAPTVLRNRDEYVAFLEAVVLRAHCGRLPGVRMRNTLLSELGAAGAADDPPFSLDYWRLNMRARRASGPSGDG